MRDEVLNIVFQLSGQNNVITCPRIFVELLEGDLQSALFLNQLLYWQNKMKGSWLFKDYNTWKEEICLSPYQVKKAADKFKKIGFLSTKIKKANGNPTVHYHLDKEMFMEWLFKNLNNENEKVDIQNLKNEETLIENINKDYNKEKISNSDELPHSSSIKQSLKDKMNKNKPLNKSKDKTSLNDDEKECLKFFDYWVNKELTVNHSKDTVICKKSCSYFSQLKKGTFGRGKDFKKESMQKNNVNIKALNRKWTDEEIFTSLDNMYNYLIEGYWPHDKKYISKKGLDSLLFNNGVSWFLNAVFNPPKSLKKNITTSNEKLYNIVREIFDDLSEAEEQKLIHETNALWKKFDELYDNIYPYATHIVSSHAGTKENPERLVKNFAEYHKQYNFDRQVGKVGPDTQSFRNFLKWMKEEHDCNLNPTERELKIMKIDYENYQMRKRNRG